MTGFMNHKRFRDALEFYDSVPSVRGLNALNDLSHCLAIKACTKCGDFQRGKAIHRAVCREQDVEGAMSMKLRNSLIHFYGQFGDVLAAQQMFEEERDTVSLNNMMRGYMDIGQHGNALALYDEFVSVGMVDDVSHLFAVMACSALKEHGRGKEVHSRLDTVDRVQCGNALIDFYAIFGDVAAAEEIWNGFGDAATAVSVNAMMKCYVDHDEPDQTLRVYDEWETMQNGDGLSSANVSRTELIRHTLAVKACSKSGRFEKGHALCDWMRSTQGHLDDVMVRIAMIGFYGNCGDIECALQLFESIGVDQRDSVCFNAMMEAYFVNEQYAECMDMFVELQRREGVVQDAVSYAIVLKAATQSMAVEFGQRIHDELRGNHVDDDGERECNILRQREVQCNLIAMYGAFGNLRECERIFEGIKNSEYDKYSTDLDIWNAMIGAYAANGETHRVGTLLRKMETLGMTLNHKVYVSLINMHGHCGDVESAERVWTVDIVDDEVRYNKFVTTAVVDSLARCGEIKRALGIVMEYEKYSDGQYHESMWSACLSGCYQHCNEENAALAQEIYQEMSKRFHGNALRMKSASVLMSNIMATVKDHTERSNTEKCSQVHRQGNA